MKTGDRVRVHPRVSMVGGRTGTVGAKVPPSQCCCEQWYVYMDTADGSADVYAMRRIYLGPLVVEGNQ